MLRLYIFGNMISQVIDFMPLHTIGNSIQNQERQNTTGLAADHNEVCSESIYLMGITYVINGCDETRKGNVSLCKTFHCKDNIITECNITDTYNSSTAYILLYKLSWNVRAVICPEGRLSSLALSSVYSPTVEDGSWSTPMVPARLSVPLQQAEEWAPPPVGWTMCFLLAASGLAWTLVMIGTSVYIWLCVWILDVGRDM